MSWLRSERNWIAGLGRRPALLSVVALGVATCTAFAMTIVAGFGPVAHVLRHLIRSGSS